MQTAGSVHGPFRVFHRTVINHPCFEEAVVYVFWTQEQRYTEEKQCCSLFSQVFRGLKIRQNICLTKKKKILCTRVNENLVTVFVE